MQDPKFYATPASKAYKKAMGIVQATSTAVVYDTSSYQTHSQVTALLGS